MRVSANNLISFKGKIIDAHAHLGTWFHYGEGGQKKFGLQDLDIFIKEPLSNGDTIDKMLVSNLDCMFKRNGFERLNELEGNQEILNLCAKNPKLAPLAVCQPHATKGRVEALQSLLDANDGRFVGLKFHPECLPLEADHRWYNEYLELAHKKKLPCLFHCEAGKSSPETIYTLAKRHPKVPIILGHMGAGGDKNHEKALKALLKSIDSGEAGRARLYADISWVNGLADKPSETPTHIMKAIRELKERDALDRLLFGTDAPVGLFGEKLPPDGRTHKQAYEQMVESLQGAIRNEFHEDADDIIDRIFYKNAQELFFDKNWAKEAKKTKVGLIVTGAVAFLGVAAMVLYNKTRKAKAAASNEQTPLMFGAPGTAPSLQNFLNTLKT